MKFGDIVRNEWASKVNPNKFLMVVRVGKVVDCLNIKGEKVYFKNDKHLRLTVVGKIDFLAWHKAVEQCVQSDLPKDGENLSPCPLCGTPLPIQDLPDTASR